MPHPTNGHLFEAVFAAAPIGVAVHDASYRFVYINPVMAAINAMPVEAHLGRTLREVVPTMAPVVEPIFARVLAGEAVRGIALSGEMPGQPGRARHWNASFIPVSFERAPAIAVYLEETTEQVAALQAMQASETRFRTIAEAAPIGILLADQPGHVIYANQAAGWMCGVSPEALHGAGWVDVLYPDDAESLRELIWRSVDEGTGSYSKTVLLRRPDGHEAWAELIGRDIMHDGQRISRLILVVNVTERRRMEAELAENEMRFRQLAEDIEAIFYIKLDEVAGLHYISPSVAAITGHAPEEFYARPSLWLEIIHPDDRSQVMETFSKGRANFRAEYRIVRPDGSVRWLSDRSYPVLGEDGRLLRIAGVSTDETERHALQQQLLQSQRMESIGRLAGGVAHDFNNILTVILSHVAFARQDPAQSAEDLVAIERAGVRAAELTAQLLAFARRQVVEPRTVDLNTLTEQVRRLLQRLVGEHVELRTVLARDLWPISVDPTRMEQVLMNLAVNARDAMAEGGTLTIETANAPLGDDYTATHAGVVPGDYVMVAVSDTGEGIDPADMPMIFEPFFTTKPVGSGTGLGLATCYGIVKQAGGHIWAYSEPGRGTTFRVYLPRTTDAAAVTTPEGAGAPRRGTETVLLVEDDPGVRAIAVRALRDFGFAVLEAREGNDALDIARAHEGEIHILVTDVVMPGMGGTTLAAHFSTERPTTRVLFTSGYTQNAIVHQGVLVEGVNFLQKPYAPRTLAKKVRAVLDAPPAQTA